MYQFFVAHSYAGLSSKLAQPADSNEEEAQLCCWPCIVKECWQDMALEPAAQKHLPWQGSQIQSDRQGMFCLSSTSHSVGVSETKGKAISLLSIPLLQGFSNWSQLSFHCYLLKW